MSERIAWIGAATAALWFVYQALIGLSMPEFGDETTKIVAARMILDGGTLYRDVIHHHSPGIFALAHGWAALVGTTAIMPYRAFMAVMLALTGLVVAASPALRDRNARLVTAGIYFLIVGTMYNAFGLFRLIYQPVSGAFFALFLALLLVPLMTGRSVPRWAAAAGSAAAVFGIATYTGFAVPAVLLTGAALLVRRPAGSTAGQGPDNWPLWAASGAGAALAAILFWMAAFADFRGFAIFNIYFNTEVYAPYTSFDPFGALKALVGAVAAGFGAIHLFCYGILLVGAALILRQSFVAGARGWWVLVPAALALIAGMAYLNPRASVSAPTSFHSATLAVAAATLLACAAGSAVPHFRRWVTPALLAAVVTVSGLFHLTARSSPWQIPLAGLSPTFEEPLSPLRRTVAARLIERVVPEGEPIYALPFAPAFYLATNRPPASGRYYYFPWDADYERAPVPGYATDVCGDLRRRRPRIIVAMPRPAWGRWPIEEYAPCIAGLIAADYTRHPRETMLHVRTDLANEMPWLARELELPRPGE